jgi:hypothetical protein
MTVRIRENEFEMYRFDESERRIIAAMLEAHRCDDIN